MKWCKAIECIRRHSSGETGEGGTGSGYKSRPERAGHDLGGLAPPLVPPGPVGGARPHDSNVLAIFFSRVEQPVLPGTAQHRFDSSTIPRRFVSAGAPILHFESNWLGVFRSVFFPLALPSDNFLIAFTFQVPVDGNFISGWLLLLLFDMQIRMSMGDCNRHSCQWHTILIFGWIRYIWVLGCCCWLRVCTSVC